MTEKKCRISLFEEKDFFEASKFIIVQKTDSSNKYLFFPEQYDGDVFSNYYRAINMRTNHFHEIEMYMNVIDITTNERVGVLGIYICPNNQVVYITSVILIDKSYLKEAIDQLAGQLKTQSVKRIKVKFTNRDKNKVAEWAENGFKRESIIIEEGIKGSDFLIFGKEL